MKSICTTLEVMGFRIKTIVSKINEYIAASRLTNEMLRTGAEKYSTEIELTYLEAFSCALQISQHSGSEISDEDLRKYSKTTLKQLFELQSLSPEMSKDISNLIELLKYV